MLHIANISSIIVMERDKKIVNLPNKSNSIKRRSIFVNGKHYISPKIGNKEIRYVIWKTFQQSCTRDKAEGDFDSKWNYVKF